MTRKFLTTSITLALAAYFLISFWSSTALAVTLGINGDAFTVDGQKKFLVLAGYWDALDAPNVVADLNYLVSKGFDGIRVFPNLWEFDGTNYNPGTNAVIRRDGSIDQTELNKLISVIDLANQRGMIVDVSFARETIEGDCTARAGNSVICEEQFKQGVVSVANALKNKTNVFYDLQNEHDHQVIDFSSSHAVDLKNRIENAVGSSVILSISSATPSLTEAINIARNYGMDLVNVHFACCGKELNNANLSAASTSSKPVYVGEPYNTRSVSGYSSQDLISGMVNAKNAGVAAWTFHSDASFELNGVSYQSQLENNELAFVNSFRSQVDSTQWGITGGSGSTACIDPAPSGSTVPDMSSVVNQVAAEHPDWLQSSCTDYQFLDEVVRRLRAGSGGTRWAFECKRANCNDPWKEGISYYYGVGNSPQSDMDKYEVFGIDIAHQDCANPQNNTPFWGVADWPYRNPGVVQVAYLYPRTAGGSLPSPVMCSSGGGTGGGGGGNTGGSDQNPQIFCDEFGLSPLQPGCRYEKTCSNCCGGGSRWDRYNLICPSQPGPQPGPEQRPEPLVPVVLILNPTEANPGQKIEIVGLNLGNKIILESNSQRIELNANVNQEKTRASIDLPSNLSPGVYSIIVVGENVSEFAPDILTITQASRIADYATFQNPKNLGDLIQTIFQWALWLVGLAVFVNFLWAGILWLTAAGRPGPIAQAKEKMWNALIGAIILLASYLILNTINPDLVKQTFTLPGL